MNFKLLPIPHLVIKVKSLKGAIIGQAHGFVIILEDNVPDYVYYHELEHVKQWYMTLGMHSFLYLLIKQYKLWSEVQAFKVEVSQGRSLESAAKALMWDGYDFGITIDAARKLLSE